MQRHFHELVGAKRYCYSAVVRRLVHRCANLRACCSRPGIRGRGAMNVCVAGASDCARVALPETKRQDRARTADSQSGPTRPILSEDYPEAGSLSNEAFAVFEMCRLRQADGTDYCPSIVCRLPTHFAIKLAKWMGHGASILRTGSISHKARQKRPVTLPCEERLTDRQTRQRYCRGSVACATAWRQNALLLH